MHGRDFCQIAANVPGSSERDGKMEGACVKKVLLSACVASLLVLFIASAESRPWHRHHAERYPVVVLPPLEAKGCYFYRGRRHCGSFCYWEINGKRYCQTREREAVPQADVWIDDAPPVRELPRGRNSQGLK